MFTKAQEIASWYQSPGPAGIGFAVFASSGTVTPELWENIRRTERDAETYPEDKFPEYKDWGKDMKKLRELLAEDGIYEYLAARDAFKSYGKDYADYIERHTAELVAKGYDVGGQNLGEALAGNDGD